MGIRSQQFPLAHRLVKPNQFKRVFNHDFRSHDQYFVVLARRNHLTYARLGLAVSRKVAGDAVPRNRLKRLIRETFRMKPEWFPAVDCVVMAKTGAVSQTNQVLITSLEHHWVRVAKKCKN